MKIAIILGTRPEIIKMSPIIRECEKKSLDYFILHTGQHYSYQMDKVFFRDLKLQEPKYNLDIGSDNPGAQTGKMLLKIESVLLQEKPDIVFVQGDTNTVLAGALTAKKLNIRIGHIEAGLRSFDHTMPEEINRILTDHISDYLFAPTPEAKKNLTNEGIGEEKILVCGNTIVDAVFQNIAVANSKGNVLNKFELEKDGYFLVTAHRQENVDNPDRLSGILKGLELIRAEHQMPIVFSIHPRTRKKMNEFGYSIPDGILAIDPPGFLEFLQLEKNAKLILTDSGGVQEESCILHVPCLTMRNSTERPETLTVGSNILVQTVPEMMLEGVNLMINSAEDWENPYGDGTTARQIIQFLMEKLS